MKTQSHYLPVTRANVDWGLYLTAIGMEHVPPRYKTYPYPTHPALYDFTWEKGRVLPEYQVLYLTRGRMIYESAAAKQQIIEPGSVVLIYPGVWHRYKPDPVTGWEKYWLSANGEDLYRLAKRKIISPQHSILHCGLREKIRRPYLQIWKLAHAHPVANPHGLAAHLMQLLAEVIHADERHATDADVKSSKTADPLIHRALSHIWNHSHRVMTVDTLAAELAVGRRTLERHFRIHLGRSILTEITDCRLQRAKYLLRRTKLPVDHVAMSAGFPSTAQLINIFRQHEHRTPTQYRNQQ